MKIQISIEKLEQLIDTAKRSIETDSDLSHTLELELVKSNDTHLGDDKIYVEIKSGYAECNSKGLMMINNLL